MPPTTRPDPWERQPGEPPRAWNGFKTYRDQGPTRSIAKTATTLGKGTAVLHDWSRRHAWSLRVAAWDAEQDRLYQSELRVAMRESAQKHVNILESLNEGLLQWAQAFAVEAEGSANGVANLINAMVKLHVQTFQPAVAGVPVGDGLDGVDVDELSAEDVRAMQEAILREATQDLAEYPDVGLDDRVADPLAGLLDDDGGEDDE
jgi:hypothetical protein